MVTAADGAEQFYTSQNNEARYETVAMAKELDKKLINAWIGHPHFSIIPNKHESFQKKVDQAVETVCNYIGMPTPTSFYKKFLIRARGQLEIQLKQIKGEQIKMEYF